MATFYTIQISKPEETIPSRALYTTFERACDAMEKVIHEHIAYYEIFEAFRRPNREELFKRLQNNVEDYEVYEVDYYEFPERKIAFTIAMMTVKD